MTINDDRSAVRFLASKKATDEQKEAAAAFLLARHRDHLRRRVAAVLASYPRLRADADDFVQLAFIRLLERARRLVRSRKFRRINTMFPWLWRVAFRKILDEMRKIDRCRIINLGDHDAPMKDQHDSTNDWIDVRELLERRLNPQQLEIFRDYYFGGSSVDAIAGERGVVRAFVYRTLHKCRQRLQRCFAPWQAISRETILIRRSLHGRPELNTAAIRDLLDRVRQAPAREDTRANHSAWRQLQNIHREVRDQPRLKAEILEQHLFEVLSILQGLPEEHPPEKNGVATTSTLDQPV
jgi:RNA polymerase sigma factor (sigma-70 family)